MKIIRFGWIQYYLSQGYWTKSLSIFLRGENIMAKRVKRKISKETKWAYFFIMPTVIGLLLFYILPAISSFALSFTRWDGITAPDFVGFENIKALFSNQ